MTEAPTEEPVVVTFREIEKVLTGQEALGNLDEVARADTVSPIERAATMAAVGHALKALRKADEEADANVMTTAQHAPSSRLQSLVASGEAAKLTFAPLPSGGLEAKFDTSDWFGWASVAWAKLKSPIRHAMLRPKRAVPEPLADTARVAVLGDWGTGLYGAPQIARAIRNDPDPFAAILHLGDTYYSGSEKEMQQRFLDLWPARPGAVSRALNSNHDMYSGGFPFFDRVLPAFGQEASYFALQNRHWTLVGLDVAYVDHAIDDEQVDWLQQILAQAGDRKVVLFSHHQLYSHFESQGTSLWTHPGFGQILRSKRIFAWYWGHEHRCSLFEQPDPTFGLWGRCIGHGGMPQSRKRTRNLPLATEKLYERAEWRRSPPQTIEGNPLPSVVVLEGRNPLIKGEEDKFSPHGYAVLTLDGPTLTEQVLDPSGQVLYENILKS